ncbi:MAG TPA: aminotransferase class I/II-fold pyridoxal phosphate-dependent enzyme [Longimicrobiales bacterium]|nr:aminotransferase class I/II-fold pyridoxal phosphate-dependent enzyme [Longimicrobiales bacterium]
MSSFQPFVMERWQSMYENLVDFNLSESGVDPVTLAELLALAGDDGGERLAPTRLGYGQSNGTEALRLRIAELYHGAGVDDVVVCNGSAEANFLAVWELVEAGDEVVIIVPTYMQTHGLARSLGARVVEVPLREELGWQPDPDEIRRAVTDRTRLLVATNPGNPTGAVFSDTVRGAITEAVSRSGAWLLADEVYTGAELDGPETPSFLGACERVIATGSLSKAYGLPGLRIGWAVTDRATADALWARSDYTTISPGDLTDRLARVALDPAVRPQLLQRTRSMVRRGLDTLEEWLHARGGFHWRAPDAGAICFVRYDADIDSATLAERLRAEQSVLVVPGAHFGLGPYLRLSLGVEPDYMRRALERIGTVVDGQ